MHASPAANATDRSVYAGARVGIMQPYFFPYLGYFGLIATTDRWIVFDPVQYIRKGWVNRNRVLKNGGGWKYVNVAVAAHERDTLITNMRLAPGAGADASVLIPQLDHYRNARAPHYAAVIDLLQACYAPLPTGQAGSQDRLVPFLVRTIEQCCAYIGLPFRYEVYSGMGLEHEPARAPGEWALNICAALGASRYVNPPGGRAIFDPERFKEKRIELLYHEQALPEYDQRTGAPFEAGLSIIDVMMFNSPEAIRAMLAQHRLLTT